MDRQPLGLVAGWSPTRIDILCSENWKKNPDSLLSTILDVASLDFFLHTQALCNKRMLATSPGYLGSCGHFCHTIIGVMVA